MRDIEEGMAQAFWDNAERICGLGYDGAVLGVSEDPDPTDADERFTVWVAPPETHEDHSKWKYDLRASGHTRREALEKLSKLVDRRVRADAYKAMREALPYATWRKLAEEAELLLSAEHHVILGSKGDDEEAIGMTLLRRSYWSDVRREAQGLIDEIKSGEITDSEEFDDRLHEIEVIYTSDAHKYLWFSENSDAYEEEMGQTADTIEAAATVAFQADVREAVGRSVEVQHLREIDCPRCGDVVIWTDPDEEETCRKCGYPTRVEVSRARANATNGVCVICETCVADHPDETFSPVGHLDAFTCDECGGEYTQPKEEPPTKPAPEEAPDGDPEP